MAGFMAQFDLPKPLEINVVMDPWRGSPRRTWYNMDSRSDFQLTYDV